MAKPNRPTRSTTSSKSSDVEALIQKGLLDPLSVFDAVQEFAASADWRVREVAATVLVRIGKKHPEKLIAVAKKWSRSQDENVRRAASEGLRGLARTAPHDVVPVLRSLRADPSLYVKKSVANILRDASRADAALVLATCVSWARERNPHTQWIVKHGIRKLDEGSRRRVLEILDGQSA